MLKWIAVLTMLIDHIGLVMFPESEIWRIIGRVAFPLYTYFLIIGMEKTRNRNQYIERLLKIGVISQLPYYLIFQNLRLNVIFTFIIAALCIYIFVEKWRCKYVFLIASILIMPVSNYLDYGYYGIALCFLYYFFKDKPVTLLVSHLFLNILDMFIFDGSLLQLFSLVGTILILNKSKIPDIPIQRLFYQLFYPTHLFIIFLISTFRE
jgi:hypothetical protein